MATTEDILAAAGVKQKPAIVMNADLQSRLNQADAEYRKRFNRPLPITSTVRTKEQQEALYAGRGSNAYPVAAPGTSKHETGNAFDVDRNVPESFLNEFGLHRPIKSDPVHVELMPIQEPKTTIQEAAEQGFTFAGPDGTVLTDQPSAPAKPQGVTTESIMEAAANVQPESKEPTVADTKAKYLGRKLASYTDVIAGLPGQIGKAITGIGAYAVGRGLAPLESTEGLTQEDIDAYYGRTAEQAATEREKVEKAVPEWLTNPVGALSGTTKTPEYQTTLPLEIMDFFNNYGVQPTKNLLVKAGMKQADANALVDSAMFALPAGVSKVSKLKPVQATTRAISDATKTTLAKITPAVKAELKNAVSGFSTAPPAPKLGEAGTAGVTSVGAAATSQATEAQSLLAGLSPEKRNAILARNIPLEDVNLDALRRIAVADSLPDKSIHLSAGEAAQNPGLMSEEFNMRGGEKGELNRQRMENNQKALINNLELIRHEAAPDVHSTKMIDAGQNIIEAYKELDAGKQKAIDAAYEKLRDAAGGNAPVDAGSLYERVKSRLEDELLGEDLPKELGQLERFANADNMTFSQYLKLRRNLSEKARGDSNGSVRAAAGLAIEELDNFQLKGESAKLKPLADEARKLARERFQSIDLDPAYKAAIKDVAPADFFNNHVLKNKRPENLQRIIDTFGEGSKVHQEMASGLMHYLYEKSGAVKGKFLQDTYNNALRELNNKNLLPKIIDPALLKHLNSVGEVASLLEGKSASAGAYKNFSGSATALQAMAERVANTAEEMGNIATMQHGIPLQGGSIVRKGVGAVKKVFKKTPEDIFYKKSLQPGAGVSLKDISTTGK